MSLGRLKNPHLRAKLAEVLEAVMPHLEQVPGPAQSSMFQRERAFCTYQHAAQLAEALITVFVDIEFTGNARLLYTAAVKNPIAEQLRQSRFYSVLNKSHLNL